MFSPAFQFYPKQWLGDNHVMLMDWDVQGMHIHLMAVSWQEDEPGTLPKNEETLRKILKNPRKKDWENRIFPQLLKAWPTWEEDSSRMIQKGVRAEYIKQLTRSEKARKSAYARWNPEGRKDSTDANAFFPHMQEPCLAGEKENGVENDKVLNNKYSFSRMVSNRDPDEKPGVESCLRHYELEYQRIFQKTPMVFAENDSGKLQPVVAKYGVHETNQLITQYLETREEELIAKRGWPLCLFPSAINRLLINRPRGSPIKSALRKVPPPLGVDPSQSVKWEKCLEKIEEQILPENFETWIYPLAFAGIKNGQALIICPDSNYVRSVKNNYQDLIEKVLKEIFAEPAKINFQLDSG